MRLITFLLLALLLPVTSKSQKNKSATGIECGPGLTSLRGNEILENLNDPAIGFSFGILFQYNISTFFSIHTNLSFERKGIIGKDSIRDVNGNYRGVSTTHSNFNYLTIPVLIRTSFGSKIKFFLNTGPFFSYLLKQNTISKGATMPRTTANNTNLFKRFDAGISTGGGIIIPYKNNLLFSGEIRNNRGLNNISDLPVYNNGTIKTNALNLLFSAIYKPGKRLNGRGNKT
jgi:Outer membrane protein beta-barrel domain